MNNYDATEQAYKNGYSDGYAKGYEHAMEAFGKHKRTGHWSDYPKGRWIYKQCSECGTISDAATYYCHYCGARNIESEVENNE